MGLEHIFDESGSFKPQMPFYDVLNPLPLPLEVSAAGTPKGLFNCFNCGSEDHKVRECRKSKDQSCISLNMNWMKQFGTSGSSSRSRFSRVRYYDGVEKIESEGNDGKEMGESKLHVFENLEEMPPVSKTKKLSRTTSITEMNQEERNRRPRHSNYNDRVGRFNQNSRGNYNNRWNNNNNNWNKNNNDRRWNNNQRNNNQYRQNDQHYQNFNNNRRQQGGNRWRNDGFQHRRQNYQNNNGWGQQNNRQQYQ
eukprot:UN24983